LLFFNCSGVLIGSIFLPAISGLLSLSSFFTGEIFLGVTFFLLSTSGGAVVDFAVSTFGLA
jgi:hypothetical protein